MSAKRDSEPSATAARRRARGLAALALVAAAAGALAAPEPPPRAAPAPATAPAPAPATAPPRVVVVDVTGAITGGTAEYVLAALAKARVDRADALAMTLDTPGGALDATREIVQALLASEVPVLVWVGPAGARAGSAGVFLTLAADVATMHPTSNIGAAHPVTGSGRDVEAEAGKDMAKKVENDTAAFARSVAAGRGRNADWAEKAVRESVSITADVAVKERVVELTAPELRLALDAADGRMVKPGGGPERALRTRGAVLEPYEKTLRQRVISFLADPNVLALLMLIGTLGIAIEFYNPGGIVPGILGGFALFLAFMGMRVIPVNVGAVVLILVGVGLLVAEAYVTVHGLAGLAGAACIVLGTLFFVDRASPDYRFVPGALTISPWIVWPTPLAVALALGFMAWKVAASRRAPLQLGVPALVGTPGEALSDIGPRAGEAFVHGEYWQARSDGPIPKGARVRVVAVDGLTVRVVADAVPPG
jgi:membrane-bound serine protease (ClpP class)